MDILKRLLGTYFLLVAAAVATHWVVTPLYDNSSGEYPVWVLLNWFMAPAVALVLIVNVLRKLDLKSMGSITRQYLEVNLAFYASIVLALWFYWNWFYSLFPANEPEIVGTVHLQWWAFINPLMALVLGATGAHQWRDAPDDD